MTGTSRTGGVVPARRTAPVDSAPTALLVVLAALLGAVTTLVLIVTVVGALMGTAAPTADPARAAGRLVGGALVVGVPLVLTALHAWMALAVRAGRSWPVRVLTVLAVLGGIRVVAIVLVAVWTAGLRLDHRRVGASGHPRRRRRSRAGPVRHRAGEPPAEADAPEPAARPAHAPPRRSPARARPGARPPADRPPGESGAGRPRRRRSGRGARRRSRPYLPPLRGGPPGPRLLRRAHPRARSRPAAAGADGARARRRARAHHPRGQTAELCALSPTQAGCLLRQMVENGLLVLHGDRRWAWYGRG